MKTVAMEHAGFSVEARSACGEGCFTEIDVCIWFEETGDKRGECEKAFKPCCGKYAGVAAILNEARKFVLDRETAYGKINARDGSKMQPAPLEEGSLLCIHAFSGGLGTSCAAIGIGREISRYRNEKVLYLSLEDAEDAGLFPADLSAMRAEEALYRYLRLLNTGAGQEGFDRLFRAAAARDEYGLYRLAPDEGVGSLSGLTPGELYLLLTHASCSLGLTRIVLDFGTRLNYLKKFAGLLGEKEAFFIEICSEPETHMRKKQVFFMEDKLISASFPICGEDVRQQGGKTEIGLSNAFGLAVKETCDRIIGDKL